MNLHVRGLPGRVLASTCTCYVLVNVSSLALPPSLSKCVRTYVRQFGRPSEEKVPRTRVRQFGRPSEEKVPRTRVRQFGRPSVITAAVITCNYTVITTPVFQLRVIRILARHVSPPVEAHFTPWLHCVLRIMRIAHPLICRETPLRHPLVVWCPCVHNRTHQKCSGESSPSRARPGDFRENFADGWVSVRPPVLSCAAKA